MFPALAVAAQRSQSPTSALAGLLFILSDTGRLSEFPGRTPGPFGLGDGRHELLWRAARPGRHAR